MTILLDKAVAATRVLPAETQDEIAQIMLMLAGQTDQPIHHLTDEEDADLARSDLEVERREFATDAQMRAIWAKYAR